MNIRRSTLPVLIVLLLVGSLAFAQDFSLARGFWPDPHVEPHVAGGPHRISGCPGYVSTLPDHVMFLADDFEYLRLFVDSRGRDTTLILHQPSTGDVFCDDDGYGNLQPEIVMDDITAGVWHVYVGSYWPDETHPYRLNVTEFSPRIDSGPAAGVLPNFNEW